MPARDKALAIFTAAAWGLALVATKYGLGSFSATQLTALRFIIACLPVLVLPRPQVPWRVLILTGLTLLTGQCLLLYFAHNQGLPPGLASVTQPMPAFFTVILAALVLRELPTVRQGSW